MSGDPSAATRREPDLLGQPVILIGRRGTESRTAEESRAAYVAVPSGGSTSS
jgi:hypothetical protein